MLTPAVFPGWRGGDFCRGPQCRRQCGRCWFSSMFWSCLAAMECVLKTRLVKKCAQPRG